MFRGHAVSGAASPAGDRTIAERIGRFIDERRDEYHRDAEGPVLLHGDFKVSNLFWVPAANAPLVLDWEFAYSGPALMDVGQLFRWEPSEIFARAFAASYRGHGGTLPDGDWRRAAASFDLVNLCGLLERAEPGSRRAIDVREGIVRTLGGY
jgi:aminoglycoside phosphotransferase (APT) family kinase protein